MSYNFSLWRVKPLALCLVAVAACVGSLWAQDPVPAPVPPAERPIIDRELVDDAVRKGGEMVDKAGEKSREIADDMARKTKEAAEYTRAATDSAVAEAGVMKDSAVAAVDEKIKRLKTGGKTVGGVTIYEPRERDWRTYEGAGRVLVVRLDRPVDPTMMEYVRHAYLYVDSEPDIRAVILDMNTPGGDGQSLGEIIGIIRESPVPTYTYVNREAISAGAIIALGTRGIYMRRDAIIGDSMPIFSGPTGPEAPDALIKEKILAYMRPMVTTLCQENGHIPELALAMLDPDYEVVVGSTLICPEGQVLSFTSEEALAIVPPLDRPLMAAGLAESPEEVMALIGMADAQMFVYEPSSSQQFALFLAMISPLLITGMMLGIYIEMNTPGVGLPAGVAALCGGLFILGHIMIGQSTAWEPVIFFVGLVFLAIEIFVIPGFGAFGIIGLLTMLAATVMMMMPEVHTIDVGDVENPFGTMRWGYLEEAFIRLSVGVGLGGIGVLLASRFLPQSALFNRIALQQTSSAADGYVAFDVDKRQAYIGQEGVALTDLRPGGTIKIGHERIDVVCDSDFVRKGDRVRVVEVNGPRIAVVLLAPDAGPATEGHHA